MLTRRLLVWIGLAIAAAAPILALLYSRPWRWFAPPFDIVVYGGQIYDGRGNPPRTTDIGIRRGRIQEIGNLSRYRAARKLYARGLAVAPGFIDVHTHIESNIPHGCAPLRAPNFAVQGVTTLVTGNCGSSSIGQLLRRLSCRSQLNIATLAGHNTLRAAVMGQASRHATAAEIARMSVSLEDAMRQGALGLSTGLAYAPGMFAATGEIATLARVAGAYNGLYVSHIRDESIGGEEAIDEALSIGRQSGAPVHISHFKVSGQGQWSQAEKRLQLVRDAIRNGLQVTIDQYPYEYSSTTLDLLFPPGALSTLRNAADPAARREVIQSMLERLRQNRWPSLAFARVAWYGPDHNVEGLTIPEICRKSGRPCDLEDQAETALMLRLKGGGAQMIYEDMAPQDVDSIFRYRDTMAGSDSRIRYEHEQGKPHPRGFGTFPRILANVRTTGVIDLADAIRRMTGLPAQIFGLSDRGIVEVGRWADLVIFDHKAVRDNATLQDPFAPPEGVLYVLVNGDPVLWEGTQTPALPGMFLRRERSVERPSLALSFRY